MLMPGSTAAGQQYVLAGWMACEDAQKEFEMRPRSYWKLSQITVT
jgi:hypothetical protein